MNVQTSLTWIDATAEMPDSDLTVLIATSEGPEVELGFHDGEEWRCVTCEPGGSPVLGTVTHWADLPEHPDHVSSTDH